MKKVAIKIPEAAHESVKQALQERFTCDLHVRRLTARAGDSRAAKDVRGALGTLVVTLRVEEDQLRSLHETVAGVMATVQPGLWEMVSPPAKDFGKTGLRDRSQRFAQPQGGHLYA
jgi:hypothetical protein